MVLVDDHDLVVFAVSSAFEDIPGIEIVGTAGSVAGAMTEVARHQPDVVLLDRRLPDGDGVDVLGELLSLAAGVRVLIFTGVANKAMVDRVAEAGGAGVVLKGGTVERLADTIRAVSAGATAFDLELPSGTRTN
jgi:DNA-binding NarL/FixJ family response regulator